MPDIQFDMGRHEASIQQLLKNDEEMMAQLNKIEQTLAEQRGARRVALWAAGVVGGLIGAIFRMGGSVWIGKHI